MASIPLPALDVRPPAQQPSALDQYGQILALRNQMQEQPLRQQALQQGLQAGQLDIQQQQQQLKDRQAMTSAMNEWDGKDYNDLMPLVLKNGGSATAVMGLKKNVMDMQTQIATAAKDNAAAAASNVETIKNKNDMITGALGPLVDPKQVPDEQLGTTLTSTVQDLTQKGLLDPQHAQAAEQLLQSGNPAQIRQGVDQFRKTLMAQSQITQEALQTAQTADANANTGKTTAETNY
jgi:hypothetical protein